MRFDTEKLKNDLRVKRLIERNITLREAAVEIGASIATLSRVENAKLPDVLTFGRICTWLGTDMKSYFKNTEE